MKLSLCSGNREIWKTPHFPAATAGHQASKGLTQILNILSVSVHSGEFSWVKAVGLECGCAAVVVSWESSLVVFLWRKTKLPVPLSPEGETAETFLIPEASQEPSEKQECREALKD